MSESENYTFFKIAEGFGGHNQTLALFAKTNLNAFGEEFKSIQQENTTLHHFALEIDKKDYKEIKAFFNKENIAYITEVFEWVSWKSIFIKDPELNIIEFVCYDSEI